MELDVGWARIALLPSAPYSADGASSACVMGVALERQQGVHAVAGEARRDFDAWPGEFALAAPGVPVFSESAHGGEYVLVAVEPAVAPHVAGAPRRLFRGQRDAVALARNLRRLLLAQQPDVQQAAQQAAQLLAHGAMLLNGAPERAGAYGHDRIKHARVLDAIEAGLATPLQLDALAALAGMPLLRFLRSFTHATGMTPHAWITERRLQRARHMLRSTNLPLADVAAACGFTHQSHLGALLKREITHSPAQYRSR
ncbi:helix-turn-helix domain-containing protein [Duganella ginsengisoli]|uniref:Helix-turn-helix domain-containing protein n=1 Tax=Pseudoduganella ginsengisoli TaxID=1462440 RepID=A0A6L6Q6M4_9BURK|nr:helix-turn-helix domain-containing protein [Pseudoduganella ginsengisoli]